MDLNNYPLHLTSSELDYELNIRGVFNLVNNRLKTAALRELLHKEQNGLLDVPKRSDCFDTQSEISTCGHIYKELVSTAEEAIHLGNRSETLRCMSRFLHLQTRLERISPKNAISISNVKQLLDSVYSALVNVAEALTIARAGAKRVVGITNKEFHKDSTSINVSDRVNPINSSSMSDSAGAVGGNVSGPPRETMSDVVLTNDESLEIEDMLKELDRNKSNPFKKDTKQALGARSDNIN